MSDTKGSILGNAVLRREDPSLLKGEDLYYDDMAIDGVGFVHFVRSTIAHATFSKVETDDAKAMPGVVGVWTHEDLELAPFLSFPLIDPAFSRPLLAKDKVRFVGDIVAVIVAESREAAVDASEAVFFDFEPLPAVVDMEKAVLPDSALLFEEKGTNVCFETGIGEGDPMEGATHVTELKMESQRLAGVPIEPNGCVVVPEGDHLTVWIPSQNPISVRDALVPQLGLDTEKVRVVAPSVGGGFGPKGGIYAEFIIVTALAQKLGQPLKWTETRSEDMVSLAHGRAMVLDAKMGFDADGVITGFDCEVIADAGSYPAIGSFLTVFTQTMIQGTYVIPQLRYHALSVATNTTFTAAYRGAGRPEATQLLERILDKAAGELNIDPAEIRRKNFIPADAFPITTHGGANYDCGEYEEALDAVLKAADYPALRAEQAKRRDAGDPVQMGIGVAAYVEVTAPAGMHVEYGAVEVGEDGKVTARVGTSAHGQGHITAFSMIISDMLGVPMEDVIILQSDTAEIPRGQGTMGSRSLQTAGSAVHVSSEIVLDKAKNLAAHLLEANVEDIVKGEGGLHVAGVPANAKTWGELAVASNDESNLPEGMEAGLSHEGDFDGSDATFPFGAHISVVDVDTETGQVKMVRHIAVDDCGKILNPMLVTGQQHGGIAQGAAQALFEGVTYDTDGNPTTANLADYGIPSAAELINYETSNIETPTPRNPLGAKGIGESGTIGSTPSIHNAVIDALSGHGVTHIDMPLTPMKIWEAINA